MTRILPYKPILAFLCCAFCFTAVAQLEVTDTDSWQKTMLQKHGQISVLWYDIEPFIYRDNGKVIGVEYELMEGFKGFLRQKYSVELSVKWVDAGAFENIYPYIKSSGEKGLFGLSFYSITDERKKDVKFSPAYMPDLNVLVTNNSLPVYETDKDFIKDLTNLKGYTMKQTTMEEDLVKLKKNYSPSLQIFNEVDDYEVLKQISAYQNAFGYVPVSIYVIALQRGIKIKRQRVMATKREGFAAIYTKTSDWDEPVNAYFNSPECKVFVSGLIRKYLGTEVADIILEVSSNQDTASGKSSDIELLTKEREIVTQRLIDTALEAERSTTQRNIFLVVAGAVIIIAGIGFSRYRTKNRLSKILQQRNELIAEQKEKMEVLNRLLNMKILQSKLNPHFLFNSLNAIQYHIGADDKKGALQYITRFSNFLRKVLQSSDEILIPASGEAMLAEQYLWLEQNRFPGRFVYTVNVPDDVADAETPPLLIHSIIQESLYNNILNSTKDKDLFLKIDFSKINGELLIRVSDNGLEKTNAKNTTGSDSEILAQRLQAINNAALQPVEFSYRRNGEENITELKIPQPLFQHLN